MVGLKISLLSRFFASASTGHTNTPKAYHQARGTVVWDSVIMGGFGFEKPSLKKNSPILQDMFLSGRLRADLKSQTLKHVKLLHSIHLARPAKRTSERSRHKTVTIQTVHSLVGNSHNSATKSLDSNSDCQRMALGILYPSNNTFCSTISRGSMHLTHICVSALHTNKKIKFSTQDVFNLINKLSANA